MNPYDIILKWLIPILIAEVVIATVGCLLALWIAVRIVRYFINRRRLRLSQKTPMQQYWKQANQFTERLAQNLGIIPKSKKPWYRRLFRS